MNKAFKAPLVLQQQQVNENNAACDRNWIFLLKVDISCLTDDFGDVVSALQEQYPPVDNHIIFLAWVHVKLT